MSSEFKNRPFVKLKKKIASRPQAPPPPPPQKIATEEDTFNDAMNGVHAIKEFRVLPCSNIHRLPPSSNRRADPDGDALAILTQIARGDEPINLSDTQEYVEWTNPDSKIDITEKLHAGRFSVQTMLDLHGATMDEVNSELDAFLENSFKRGWQCLKIIHGRGLRSVKGPVLKNAVVKRLSGRYRNRVIAFVSARQCDGGLGALYVLLRG